MASVLDTFVRRQSRETREQIAEETTEGQRVEETDSFTRVVSTETGEVLGGEHNRSLEPTTEQKAAAGRQTTDFSSPGVRDRFEENLDETARDVDASGTVQTTRVTGGGPNVTVQQIPENIRDRTTDAQRRQATGGDLEGQGTNINLNLPQLPSVGALAALIIGVALLFVAVSGFSRGAGQGALS